MSLFRVAEKSSSVTELIVGQIDLLKKQGKDPYGILVSLDYHQELQGKALDCLRYAPSPPEAERLLSVASVTKLYFNHYSGVYPILTCNYPLKGCFVVDSFGRDVNGKLHRIE